MLRLRKIAGVATLLTVACLFWLLSIVVASPGLAVIDLIKSVSVDRVHARHAVEQLESDRPDAITVTVGRNGDLFFGSDKINPEDLPNKIKDRMPNGPRPLYINADRRADYANVKLALDAAHAAGVSHIVFLTEKRPPR